MIVWAADGRPLPQDEGPFRLVALTDGEPSRCLRQLQRIEVVDPTDRRVFRVKLTPEGQKQFRRMAAEHEQWIIGLFEGMSLKQKNQLVELLGDLKRQISQSPEH